MKKLEDRKLTIYSTQENGSLNIFQYERYDETMISVRKYDWNDFVKLSKNGSCLLFEYDGCAFLESTDANDRTHYLIGISYWDTERPDTFFELKINPFNKLMAMCLIEESIPLFNEEMKTIEFGGQLLEHLNQQHTA